MTTTPPPGDHDGRDERPDGTTDGEFAPLTAPDAPAGTLDAARAAALTAFDEIHAGPGHDTERSGGVVRDLSSARSRRWYERLPLGAVAAAVAVIALVGVFTQIDLDGGGDDDLATAADESTAEFDADDSAGDSAGDAGSDSFSSPQAAPTEENSNGYRASAVYTDLDAFVADVGNRYDPTGSAGPPPAPSTTVFPTTDEGDASADDGESPAGAIACDPVLAAGVDPGDVFAIESAFLEVEGITVTAIVYGLGSGDFDSGDAVSPPRLAVVDIGSCERLEDRAL